MEREVRRFDGKEFFFVYDCVVALRRLWDGRGPCRWSLRWLCKNSGVASGNGLPARVPMTMRCTLFRLHQMAARVMRMMLRPGM